MRTITMIVLSGMLVAPAVAQVGSVHDPFRPPSLQEERRERDFDRQRAHMERERSETRETVRRGMDDRDPNRGAIAPLPPRERFGQERRP